jgi:5-methylcytosine-specific restriction endonuclease McrA
MPSVEEAAACAEAARQPRETRAQRTKRFLSSRAWQTKRYEIIRRDKGRCQYCGRTAADGVTIQVDHREPLSKRWDLRLADDNLVCCCNDCNFGKLAGPAAEIAAAAGIDEASPSSMSTEGV